MNRDVIQDPVGVFADEDVACPNCGSRHVTSSPINMPFTYGDGASAVQIAAVVPQRTCNDCGFQYLDSAAEDAKHAAVCSHLGVMTPHEIVKLREACGLKRADFARLTRLGDATLGRWERGALIQNAAYDQFLYLLGFPENITRLRNRAKGLIDSAICEQGSTSSMSAGDVPILINRPPRAPSWRVAA